MTTPMESKSRFAQALRAQRLVITAECQPPLGADGGAAKKLAASIPQTVNAVIVSENHEEIRSCALAFAALLVKENLDPILPLVTRDRNRIALQSDALGACGLGIANLLCVSGDHQTLGVCPQAGGAFDIDPVQTLQALKALQANGSKAAQPPAFCLGAVAHPYLRPMKLNLIQTKKKVEAGAQFLLTQPLWDLAGFAEWMKALGELPVAILASVRPLASAAQAEELQKRHKAAAIPDALIARLRKAADPAKEGLAICAEVAAKAKEIQGVRGVNILSAGREDAVAAIIEQAGLTRA